MDPLTGVLGGAGLGLLKELLVDGPAAGRQNKVNAEINRYSPWTGMKADTDIKRSNPFGNMLTGALQGGTAAQSGLFGGTPPASNFAALENAEGTMGNGALDMYRTNDLNQNAWRKLALFGRGQ